MPDLDVQLREVASALVAVAPEAPAFGDLDPVSLVDLPRTRRRGPLVAVAIAAAVLLATATFALVQVELGDRRTAPAAPPDAPVVTAQDPPGVYRDEHGLTRPPTYAERLQECDTAPLSYLNRDGSDSTTLSVMDLALRDYFEVDVREDCRAGVELTYDPTWELIAVLHYENRTLVAEFHERNDDGNAIGPLVPREEAERRLAEDRSK